MPWTMTTSGRSPGSRCWSWGLLVDAVFEVFDCSPSGIEPVPALGTRVPAASLQGMTRARGEVIGVLALDRELAPRQLASAIAAFQPH